MVSYRWSFETIILVRMTAKILCVKHLAKHIHIENALIPMFVIWRQNWGLQPFQLPAYSRSVGKSFELLTTTIGPHASLLQYLDVPIENALMG